MELSLAFSPCPNDTFIFDALVNGKIDSEGLEFKVSLEDVETLNQQALQSKYDISKISYGVYHEIISEYVVLNSGSALGRGVGPLLIVKENGMANINEIVAIPGEHTTAHFLFAHAFPATAHKVFLRYDEIENYVLEGKGPGVIIHENRFTYQDKGLQLVEDLGSHWEQKCGLPIPLGGIVVGRKHDIVLQKKIDRLIADSIRYAFSHYPQLNDYIRCHAQEMSEAVMLQHIDLYVNDFTLNLGNEGKNAIRKMMRFFGIEENQNIFLD